MTRNRARPSTVRRGQDGFTLVEIMLVVLLVGITITFVNLNLDPDPEQVVKREGERVVALLRQLGEESTLRGRAMAMHVDTGDQRYGFEVLDGNEWKALEKDDYFYERRFASPVTATLSIEGDPSRETREDNAEESGEEERADGRARVVVDPVGDVTPFKLALSAAGHRVIVGLDEYANVVSRPAGDAQ